MMTTTNYTYSILQYKHSQVLGEVLNIGILIYVPMVNQLCFIYPEKLIRLKFAYPDLTSEKILRSYLKSFSDSVQQFNKQPDLFNYFNLGKSLNKFIDTELIPQDASGLQFSESRRGISYSNNHQEIINELYNFYLLAFDATSHYSNLTDETALLSRYKHLLRELSSEDDRNPLKESNRIFYDYTIKVDEEKQFKFDIAWKNGNLNCVKPVSFDLAKKENIINKAYRYFGQFTDLDPYAKINEYRFDIIVAHPQKKELFKVYDTAINLINQPKQVNIIEEKDLPDYTKKTLAAISLFD